MVERLPIALHISQDLLPISGAGSLPNGQGKIPSKVVGSGSGYGPPLAPEGTPLSRLVSSTLYVPAAEPTPSEAAQGWKGAGGKTDYDLVCVPLTNGNWQERWERMCTITSSATEADLGAAAKVGGQQEDIARIEAESWRAGGGFRRNEVNITRSGEFLKRCGGTREAWQLISVASHSAEESGSLIVLASEWLELDSPVEGIRFDSELVSA
jgi:protein arginine N-methyltransferase 5